MKREVTLSIDGVEFTVEGVYQKGYPGTWEQPPEPAYFELLTVWYEGADILPILEIHAIDLISKLELLACDIINDSYED